MRLCSMRVSAHGHENRPELRNQIKTMLKDEAD